jgi:hypothetical protein
MITPEDLARQTGYTLEMWQEVREILGSLWCDKTAETVAHIAVRAGDSLPPPLVARILVGGSGFPGVLYADWA